LSDSSDDTLRELLLQLNDKLSSFMSASASDRAVLNSSVAAIQASVAILNHNSTSMDARIKNLEETQITHKAIRGYIDDMKKSARNWVALTCTAVIAIVTVLTYFHI